MKQKMSIALHLLEKLHTLSQIFPQIKHPQNPQGFHSEFYQTLKDDKKPQLHNLSGQRGEKTFSFIP